MTKRIFITGTGTDVGKTVVTRAIIRTFVNNGLKVLPLKPVESGVPVKNGIQSPADVLALRSAARLDEIPISAFNSYLFADPVSPHLAAANENCTIKKEVILQLVKSSEKSADLIIIEGAGGLLVPLSEHLVYADLVKDIECELIIVAPDILGTINSTLLTIEAAESRGITVAGVVLNRGPRHELGNRDAIERYGQVPVLGYFPIISNDDDDDTLAAAAQTGLSLTRILKI